MTTNTSISAIERNVMRRVRTIHALRPFTGGTALAAVIFLLALYGLGREVWVARVFENAPTSIVLLPRFFYYAFLNTGGIVQALCVATFLSLLYFFRDLFRTAYASLDFARA